MKRMGVTDLLPSGSKSYGTLDDISGSYTGNRLTSVTVSTGAQVYDRRTGIRKSGTYSLGYDASGRLTSDGTRGMTSITYNNSGMLTGIRTSTIMMAVTRDGLGRKTGMAMNKFNSTGRSDVFRQQEVYRQRACRQQECARDVTVPGRVLRFSMLKSMHN